MNTVSYTFPNNEPFVYKIDMILTMTPTCNDITNNFNAIVRHYFKMIRMTNIKHDCPMALWPITAGEIAMLYIRKNHRRRNM